MAITSRKITTYAKNIVDLSDQPNKDGLTAAQLKAFFDGRTDEEVMTSINGIVDDLVATTDGASGADQIGATPLTGGTGNTVQEVLEEINGSTVHNTGDETVAGVKTFSSSPIVPAPTTDTQASTKKYVDDADVLKVNITDIVNDLTTGGTAVPLSAEQGKTLQGEVGTLASLTTTEKGSLVGAINEVDGHADTNATSIGTLASLTTTEKTNLVGAINELDTDKVETSAITNTLTETGTGKVLDARQGKTLSDKIGAQTYTEDNYVTDAQSATASIDALDMAVKDNADLISTNMDVTLTNKITNGGFATDTTGWNLFFVTLTSVGGVAEMTGQNAPDGTNRAYQVHGVPSGNKWYASADVKATTNLAGIGYLTVNILASHSGNGNWERLSFVKTRTSDTAIALIDKRTSGWDTVYFDNILVVDLTATFGAGNEPTKAEMDTLVSLVPNQWWDGTLKPSQKLLLNWQLKMIRANTAAIAAL